MKIILKYKNKHMTKYITSTLLLLIFAQNIHAQSKIILNIWNQYEQIKKQIEKNNNKNIFTLELNQEIPGTGQKNEKYKIYFVMTEEYDDDDFYEQNIKYVTKKYHVPDTNYTEEYLFDKNEKLILYTYKQQKKQQKIYLYNENIIRIDEIILDEKKNIKSHASYTKENLKGKFLKTKEKIHENSYFLIQIFNSLKTY